MADVYGKFRCRICGEEGFVPLRPDETVDGEGEFLELTCHNAHTDQYDPSVVQRVHYPTPMPKTKYLQASLG